MAPSHLPAAFSRVQFWCFSLLLNESQDSQAVSTQLERQRPPASPGILALVTSWTQSLDASEGGFRGFITQ